VRYAIFSDVHANEAALRAVLTDAADAHADRLVCLGDVLGYGPDPVAALELVHRSCHVCLAGNHDDAVAGRCGADDFTDFAADAVRRHRALLARAAIDWLRRLPHVCDFPSPAGFACAHGEFADPKRFDYVLELKDALPSWRARSEQLLFVGHTHAPGIFVLGASGEPHALAPADFTLEDGKRYLVNVGSVGYPRSGVCRSFYCIYDDCSRTVFFRSLPFDLEGYRAKMDGQGLDEAPWMRARERERRRPEVRGAEAFGRPGPARSVPESAGKPKGTERPHPLRGMVWGLFALAVAVALGAGMFALRMTPRVVELADVQVGTAEAEEEIRPVDVAPAEVGAVVAWRRCTVPSGARLAFCVRLRKGSEPAWVHVRFENGNGEPAGDGLWYQNVRQSKRSPKRGLEAPPGTTAAVIEVVKAHAQDVCEVVDLKLEPWKETAR